MHNYQLLAKHLLAGVLGWNIGDVQEALDHSTEYRRTFKRKKNGSRRVLHEPVNQRVKAFQSRFLKYFLYRTLKREWMDRGIVGFMPKRSIVENANLHLRPEVRYVYRFDFRNAFPSVTSAHVYRMLLSVVTDEIRGYVEVIETRRSTGSSEMPKFPNPPLFSSRKVRWFRKLFLETNQYRLANQPDAQLIVREFVSLVTRLVTYQGKLPQGAATSPYLLNLVVCRAGILEDIRSIICSSGIGATVTIYADDIVVSVARGLPRSVVQQIYAAVGTTSIFTLNPYKTRCYNAKRVAPLVTGLRLVHFRPSYKQRRAIDGDSDYRQRQPKHQKLLRDQYDKIQKVMRVSMPKKLIKKIRGLMHQAQFHPNLLPQVRGYYLYLRDVYGEAIPRQVAIPYAKLVKIYANRPG